MSAVRVSSHLLLRQSMSSPNRHFGEHQSADKVPSRVYSINRVSCCGFGNVCTATSHHCCVSLNERCFSTNRFMRDSRLRQRQTLFTPRSTSETPGFTTASYPQQSPNLPPKWCGVCGCKRLWSNNGSNTTQRLESLAEIAEVRLNHTFHL